MNILILSLVFTALAVKPKFLQEFRNVSWIEESFEPVSFELRLTCFVDGRIFGPSIAEKNKSCQKWNQAFTGLFANETRQLE